jgi:hypothetical protein
MNIRQILHRLLSDGTIQAEEYNQLQDYYLHKPFSVNREIKILLYTGVLLFSTSIGILIYNNLDTIGHQAILVFLVLACGGCFYYCFRGLPPYSSTNEIKTHPVKDYLLVLACLLFLTLEGYLQYRYNIFGNRYGLVTFIPSVIFLLLAYRFDHKAVLVMALSGFAGWLGLATTPKDLLGDQWASPFIIYTGILYGGFLIAVSYFSKQKNFKKHFSFSFFNFGIQLLFIATLAGCFTSYWAGDYLFFVLLGILCWVSFRYAQNNQSFYFLLCAVLYGYIGLTYFLIRIVESMSIGYEIVLPALFYFIISCAGILWFFFNYKKLLNK